MSISNNIGHSSALKDTPERNKSATNIHSCCISNGSAQQVQEKYNHDPQETLECPQQIWLVDGAEISSKRLDAYYYSPDLKQSVEEMKERAEKGEIEIRYGRDFVYGRS